MYLLLRLAAGSNQHYTSFVRQHVRQVSSHILKVYACVLIHYLPANLGMNTNDYNNGMTIFYVSFLTAELPSQLVSKKVGPDNWIPWVTCLNLKMVGLT